MPPECEIDAGERRRANQETVMGGSHWDRSNTHCDVITITESYHLLHHSWLIQYWANKKIKAIKAKHDGRNENKFLVFPFLRPKTLTPNARAHLLDSITSSCTKSARDYVPKDAHFSSSPAKSQKKSLSFEQCTFSYLKKKENQYLVSIWGDRNQYCQPLVFFSACFPSSGP